MESEVPGPNHQEAVDAFDVCIRYFELNNSQTLAVASYEQAAVLCWHVLMLKQTCIMEYFNPHH